MISIGDKAPEFNVSIGGDVQFSLANTIGKNLILYFYPRDNTSGCTKEAINFSERFDEFDAHKTIILGVSRDSPKKHAKFICKYDLRIHLISDEEGILCKVFRFFV